MFTSGSHTVACIVAHPDDEVLLAGGSLARHAALGHRVELLIIASGLDSRGVAEEVSHSELRAHAAEAAKIMGAKPPRHLGLPDNSLDSIPLLSVVKEVEAFVSDVKPSVIYTHNRSDRNVDHGVVHDAVLTACRPVGSSSVMRILAGETLSSTEWGSPSEAAFQPNVIHDITMHLDAKLAAMEAYAGEIRAFPHPRSVEAMRALAVFRGATAGYCAGEAFMLLRERA